MMKNDTIQLSLVLMSVVLMVLSACTGISKPSNFYVLSALPESETAVKGVGNESALSIGIGPITLPIYLDRSQIVTRISRNELKMDEFHRWAEPLKENFFRVLAVEKYRRLQLLSEMRLPGEATLEFRLYPVDKGKTELQQLSRYLPRGLGGLLYWYGLYPFHQWVFHGMLKGIANSVGKSIAQGPDRFAPRRPQVCHFDPRIP